MAEIARIILPLSIEKEFDYLIPENMNLTKGMRVAVNFRNKLMPGLINSLGSKTKSSRLKVISQALEDRPCLQSSHFKIAEQLAKHYPYPVSEFLFAMLPPYLRKKNELKTKLPELKKTGSSGRQKPVFIKSGSFPDRYLAWKKNIETTLKKGSVIICLPQSDYLEKVNQILSKDFPLQTVLFSGHQKIRDSFSAWIKSRKKSLILGLKSSLFYFPEDTGLIIIEEESSPYYFQESKPFYHLRQIALTVAKTISAPLIFSGNHPSLETYSQIKKNQISLIELKSKETEIKIINQNNFSQNKLINPVFLELIRKLTAEKKKGVVIWDKKGFWRAMACTNCAKALQCESCSGILQQEAKNQNWLICPYCQKTVALPPACPHCRHAGFKGKGLGIERLKEVLQRFFPELKMAALQSRKENTQLIFSTSKVLSFLYQKQEFDQGLILDTDSRLNQIDFNTTFNTFVYLKNLSLLFRETFFIFSSRTQYYLFQSLTQNWHSFYDRELKIRKQLNLPPFTKIVKIILRSQKKERALKKAEKMYNMLKNEKKEVFSPAAESPHRLRGKYRYGLTIKMKNKDNLKKEIFPLLDKIKDRGVQAAIIVR